MAAMRELDTGGPSSSSAAAAAEEDLEEGRRSRETLTESSRARSWSWRGEKGAVAVVRARVQASRRTEDGRDRRADMAWREVV